MCRTFLRFPLFFLLLEFVSSIRDSGTSDWGCRLGWVRLMVEYRVAFDLASNHTSFDIVPYRLPQHHPPPADFRMRGFVSACVEFGVASL